mgnify:CR=1 FL=1|jgi:hypothetical protein
MENFLWFVGGFIVARTLHGILNLSQSYTMLKQAEFDCLRILGSAAESIAFLHQTREQAISDPETPSEIKNQLKIQMNVDKYVFETWKSSSIKSLILLYPVRYRRALNFNDWSTAMEHYTVLCKETIKTKKRG